MFLIIVYVNSLDSSIEPSIRWFYNDDLLKSIFYVVILALALLSIASKSEILKNFLKIKWNLKII